MGCCIEPVNTTRNMHGYLRLVRVQLFFSEITKTQNSNTFVIPFSKSFQKPVFIQECTLGQVKKVLTELFREIAMLPYKRCCKPHFLIVIAQHCKWISV